jgi:hypothetical protein
VSTTCEVAAARCGAARCLLAAGGGAARCLAVAAGGAAGCPPVAAVGAARCLAVAAGGAAGCSPVAAVGAACWPLLGVVRAAPSDLAVLSPLCLSFSRPRSKNFVSLFKIEILVNIA